MIHTQEEIINALKVIQDTCKERQGLSPCENCPLSQESSCIITHQSPEQWKIRTSPPVWKAFE